MFWLIVQATNEPSESIVRLTEALTQHQKNFKVITFKQAYEQEWSYLGDNVFVYAPVSIARFLLDRNPSWIDFMPLRELRVSHYSAYLYPYMFNVGKFLPLGALAITPGIVNGQELFVRPDANTKVFSAGVHGYQDLQDLLRALEPETLVYYSTVKPIGKEIRVLVEKNEMITASVYKATEQHIQYNVDYWKELQEFIKTVPSVPGLNFPYFLDIAEDENGHFKVLEISSLNAAGFYRCDLNKVINTVESYRTQEMNV